MRIKLANPSIELIKIEMDEIMRSIKVSIDNASIITNELAEFTYKMNNGNGAY
jgi:phospholipid/cholesterol/gamma-HCH transport system substrate-binding protein